MSNYFDHLLDLATPLQTLTRLLAVWLTQRYSVGVSVMLRWQQQRQLHSIYPATRDEPDSFADDWKEIFAEEYRDMMGHGDVDQNYEEPFSGRLVVVEDWPVEDLHLGQVGGAATDPEGYLHVFHRADRTWESRSAVRLSAIERYRFYCKT